MAGKSKADLGRELEKARQAVRDLEQVGKSASRSDMQRIRDAEKAYNNAK